MHFSKILASSAVVTAQVMAAAMPQCSTYSALPCKCPKGTAYDQAVTITVIGAAARDVTALISDYFEPKWLGFVPFKTKGPNNKPGSLRTSNVPTDYGTYELTERLTTQYYDPKGGFVQRFEQLPSTVPVEYSAHNGSFSGYWITIKAASIFGDETSVTWSAYACTTV